MYVVGRIDNEVLPTDEFTRLFDTEQEAAEFISTLPDALDGVYYLDSDQECSACNGQGEWGDSDLPDAKITVCTVCRGEGWIEHA